MKIQKLKSQRIDKGWGHEEILVNLPEYCAKYLQFNSNSQGSVHFHHLKSECWIFQSGKFQIETINLDNGARVIYEPEVGDIFNLPKGTPHRIICLKAGTILEVSTQHFDNDSYRLAPGDSQKCSLPS